ncbi:MAG: hypothetical protein ACF8TS_13290, partial [Maioricimonas sp. JB049]
SPHWQILGIDSRRTIFGHVHDSRNRPQAVRALSSLRQLEWPPLQGGRLAPNVLAAAEIEDFHRVAAVLCAIRFPYAGLRVLPPGDDAGTRDVRTWCYLELAHRVRRHTGAASLLHQSRAVQGLREAVRESRLTPEETLRAALSLESLGLIDEAAALADRVSSSPLAFLFRRQLVERAQRVRQRCLSARSGSVADRSVKAAGETGTRPERIVREALMKGEISTFQQALPTVTPALRAYYSVLGLPPDTPLEERRQLLAAATESPDFPRQRTGEARFYLGCLAIEAGDVAAAVRSLQLSEEAAPNSPLAPLRSLYLSQMTGTAAARD